MTVSYLGRLPTVAVLLTSESELAVLGLLHAACQLPEEARVLVISLCLCLLPLLPALTPVELVANRDDAHFVDPLMDTKGHEEIALAFYSLVKIFKDVDVTTKNIKLLPAHSLPKQLQPGNYQQVHNFIFSAAHKCFLFQMS